MLTSYHPWDPSSINDALEVSVILPIDNDFDDDLYDYLRQINAAEIHLDHYYSYSEVYDMIMWIDNQGQWNIWTLNTTEEDTDYE